MATDPGTLAMEAPIGTVEICLFDFEREDYSTLGKTILRQAQDESLVLKLFICTGFFIIGLVLDCPIKYRGITLTDESSLVVTRFALSNYL